MSRQRILRPLGTTCRSLRQTRSYHSPTDPPATPYSPQHAAILSSALSHVPSTGFTLTSLNAGLHDHGYSPASANLFPAGGYELVKFHLATQRLSLKDKVQFASDSKLPVPARVRALLLARLRANVDAGVAPKLPEALALMSLAGNIPHALGELSSLADEIWYLAGDTQVDAGWYTKRASVAGVYAATEVFQSQDLSSDYKDTEAFLDRRLDEARTLGSAARNVLEWAEFQGIAAVNLARSLGMKI